MPDRVGVTRTPTSGDDEPVQVTCAWQVRMSPIRTGTRKTISSIDAVTALPRVCRAAHTPAASSTAFMITPPCTLPWRLASPSSMMRASVTRLNDAGVGSYGAGGMRED